jgi:DNA helicase HerA-like ATPase
VVKKMEEIDVCGQIVGGQVAQIVIREKSGTKIELGDLLVAETTEGSLILQVYNLLYGSQIPKSTREHLAGMKLEGMGPSLEFLEPGLRNYILAEAKSVLHVGETARSPKILPEFFGTVRPVTAKDLRFMTLPRNPLYLGKVRSGTKIIDAEVYLDGEEALRHHVLIPSTTGRGKSNLVKVMLWSILGQKRFGILVLDPHDEYYGRTSSGLKDHKEAKGNLLYYSANPPAGANTLVINLHSIQPDHLNGIVRLTDAQEQAVRGYFQNFGRDWIENIIRGTDVQGAGGTTKTVLQRIFRTKLGIRLDEQGNVLCTNRVFSESAGESTTSDIANALEHGKTVILDTSKLGDEAELLVGSIIANEILDRYQSYKADGTLDEKPTVSIVIEEAPRVLGQDKLEKVGDNVYSTIAREGRKFRVGLIAVTQITSAIPRDILTNLNTKIILGNEMSVERHSIMQSAAQDLSQDDRNIASLDKGEAIVSSVFTRFAVPIQIPKFEDYVAGHRADQGKKEKVQFTR